MNARQTCTFSPDTHNYRKVKRKEGHTDLVKASTSQRAPEIFHIFGEKSFWSTIGAVYSIFPTV